MAKTAQSHLHGLDPEAQPREKALSLGMKALTDEELMAIVFGTGIKGKNVLELCEDILSSYGGHLSKIARMPAREFIGAHKGIGPAKALTLLAGIELGVRAAADAVKVEDPTINTSAKAFDYMHEHLYNLDHEEFWVLYLRHNLKPLKAFRVGQGGRDATVVDAKIVMSQALLCGASAMMLFHNHPSGSLTPSRQDMELTRKLSEAARLLDLRVIDHIIVGFNEFLSMHDEGHI